MNIWKTLLETAIHAPSPHNVQPWRVRIVSESRAELFIEKRRTLPKEDTTGSFIILSMGIFIEALTILAAGRSYKLRHEFSNKLSQFTPAAIENAAAPLLPFARLYLDAAPVEPSRYPDALFLTRRTSRISLLPGSVAEELAQALSDLAQM